MNKIRCVRIIEIEGTPEKIRDYLDKTWLYPGVIKQDASGVTVHEKQRIIQSIDDEPIARISDDEEAPF